MHKQHKNLLKVSAAVNPKIRKKKYHIFEPILKQTLILIQKEISGLNGLWSGPPLVAQRVAMSHMFSFQIKRMLIIFLKYWNDNSQIKHRELPFLQINPMPA